MASWIFSVIVYSTLTYRGYVPNAGRVLDPFASGSALSVTELESVAECPFRFFLKRGLEFVHRTMVSETRMSGWIRVPAVRNCTRYTPHCCAALATRIAV